MSELSFAILSAVIALQAKPAAPPSKWALAGRAEGELRYNSNVFLLDGGQIDRMDADLPADQVSGRFDGMEAVDDVVLRPDLRLELRGPSPLGRKLDVWLDLGWEQYFQNTKRSHLEAGVGAGQTVGPRGRLDLALDFLPQYFNKNYLADGVDASGNGNIGADERIYDAGEYAEWELKFAYRHHLAERGANDRFGLDGRIALGYRDRSYGDPFPGRSEQGTWIKLSLGLENVFGGTAKSKGTLLKAEVYYKHESVDSPTENEVVLLNEALFGVDFSGDGDFTDANARVVTPVDRTRTDHEFGVSVELAVAPSVDVGLSCARTLRDFSSGEALDVSHSGREDVRDEVGLFTKFDVAKGWDVRLAWDWREQHTDRPDDPGSAGDAVDYKRHLFSLAVIYRW